MRRREEVLFHLLFCGQTQDWTESVHAYKEIPIISRTHLKNKGNSVNLGEHGEWYFRLDNHREGHWTGVTFVGLLSRVESHVPLQASWLSELFSALCALVFLHSTVHLQMSVQVSLPFESVSTLLTNEGPLPWVNSFVCTRLRICGNARSHSLHWCSLSPEWTKLCLRRCVLLPNLLDRTHTRRAFLESEPSVWTLRSSFRANLFHTLRNWTASPPSVLACAHWGALFWANLFPHTPHSWFFSPLWISLCLFKSPAWVNLFSHCGHLCSFSPEWIFWCCMRPRFLTKLFPHIWQWCSRFPFISLLLTILENDVQLFTKSHKVHWTVFKA